jgi:exonuclease SbcD
MRFLHTADWHLNDKLGRIDRTDDLRRALVRVEEICREENVDVMLVAGDLFSELARPDALRETIGHWQELFTPFLTRGGTILAITGNHDNETFCQTLHHAMTLAAPLHGANQGQVTAGRLYLAANPTLMSLPDRTGKLLAQFVLMPYPTPTRYLVRQAGQRYTSAEEKQTLLIEAFSRTIQELRHDRAIRNDQPCLMMGHVQVHGSDYGPSLFRMKPGEDVVVRAEPWIEQFAYVALGHVHKPQKYGAEHVRYSGSIEKMDLGEQMDQKGVVLFDLSPEGKLHNLRTIPLPSTPIYEVSINTPDIDLARLRAEVPAGCPDLVNLTIQYSAGTDSLEEILRELDTLYPRWYARNWIETGKLGPTLSPDAIEPTESIRETVLDYLQTELLLHDEAEREAILARARSLIDEQEADER